jgi:hypothetical protein
MEQNVLSVGTVSSVFYLFRLLKYKLSSKRFDTLGTVYDVDIVKRLEIFQSILFEMDC